MKQYVIDELRPDDYKTIKSYLDDNFVASGVEGVYWIYLEDDLLADAQVGHAECRPFYFALEIENSTLSCELLVRAVNRMRCNCIGYATEKQRNWLIRNIDAIFDNLGIKI